MAPPKPRAPPDDSRSETSSTREKLGNTSGVFTNGKARRPAGGVGAGSSLRDSTNAGELGTAVNPVITDIEYLALMQTDTMVDV
ncbi:MAG: hypothetical protein M1818_000856 [Claussenomyces sp. TS43310]|nr:MAG: hypothetical protein M1818_000856 [Claussenomyces sp. TS43310]